MNSFEIDRQTLKDLDLFNEDDNGVSVYSFFDNAKTIGGRKKLKEMMETPSSDIEVLIARRDTISFFADKKLTLDVDKNNLDFIEHYLALNFDTLKPNAFDAIFRGLKYQFSPNRDYYTITQGIADTRKLLKLLFGFYNKLSTEPGLPIVLDKVLDTLERFFSKEAIIKLLKSGDKGDSGYLVTSHYDNLFRKIEIIDLKNLLNIIYELDAYIAVAKTANDYNLCFAEYISADQPFVDITGLYHPCIKNAVRNDVLIPTEKNIFFVTGANMAGKSSYLKALGLAIYLAHLGFPVPATEMRTTVFKGLITTINLSDNIGSGYSHYFNEVTRLKMVAEKIATHDNLFIVFDELFRGTNVKDAFDASLATISALSGIKTSVFLISTHIVEIAKELAPYNNIAYKYFDAKIENSKPVFDFKLRDGVSTETLGYFIFKSEGIIQILENAALKKK